ncbi:MAG: 3-keto-5-aminohexanoate cleavage enzyme, partial [Actinomycetota bacterium]|nr:3-keto-5-aminohexanoate cleavage enzyme [Actinomycetota bacterium]
MSTFPPVIIEAALNGVTSKARNPIVPVTPDELASDALACIDAGATVVHTHTHDIFAPPPDAADAYAQAYAPVIDAHPDAILYPTTGIGPTIEVRYGHVPLLAARGLIRASFVDTGSVNLGGTGPNGLPPASDYVYTNTFNDIAYKFEVCERLGLGPSIAVFEPGFLRVVVAYRRAGKLPPGTLVKFYFSAGGYLGSGEPLRGAPPIPEALDLYLAMLDGAPIPWAVAALGGSLLDTPVARLAL